LAKKPRNDELMTAPDISIVVCTQNRADLLRGALASLADLATDGLFTYEIVVVDNGSTDETPRVIAAAAAESRSAKGGLRGIHEPKKGIVPARNRGVHEARGQWIAFFDDDQLADRCWLAELYLGAQEKQCRVVGGSVHLAFPNAPEGAKRRLDPTVRMLLGEAKFGDRPLAYGRRLIPGCGNLMIERSVFDEVGVFECTVAGRGEDTDLFKRIERAGIAAWYIPRAIVHHLTPPERLTDNYLLDLARRMGEGVAVRQLGELGRGRFALLWLAKAARLALAHYPRCVVARLRGDDEALLGRRCLAAINLAFLRAGCRRAPQSTLQPKAPAASPLLSGVNVK
jgi:glycosyltransferase involved in cell wall biosynthesis